MFSQHWVDKWLANFKTIGFVLHWVQVEALRVWSEYGVRIIYHCLNFYPVIFRLVYNTFESFF